MTRYRSEGGSKAFFFEKRSKKLLFLWARSGRSAVWPVGSLARETGWEGCGRMLAETLSTDAAPRPRSKSFNRQVHGGRGLFSAMVFVFHVLNSGLPTFAPLLTHAAQFSLRNLQYGVELFFCISGFVICGTLRRSTGPAAFIEDRAIRLLPALWCTILAISAASIIAGLPGFSRGELHAFPLWLAANLAALPGIFPIKLIHPAAWTLSYEMCFYATCAAAWRCGGGSGSGWCSACCRWACWRWPSIRGRVLPLRRAGGAGHGRGARDARAGAPPGDLADGVPGLLAGDPGTARPAAVDRDADAAVERLELALGAAAFVSVTICFWGIVNGHGGLSRMLLTRPMQFMGTISYSFYLWHPIVMSSVKAGMRHYGVVARAGEWSQLSFLVLSLPPAVLLGWLSQRVLERQAGIWLRHLLHHRLSFQAREVG